MKNVSHELTIGIDLGDETSVFCLLDSNADVVGKCSIETTKESFVKFFNDMPEELSVTVAMESGTHSPWISALLDDFPFNVLVGNPRKLRAIWDSPNKHDARDAELLARIARFDPHLLYPIQHRNRTAQMDLAVVKARDTLVETRTKLINSVRGLCKAAGVRLPSCSTQAFAKSVASDVPEDLWPAVSGLLDTIGNLSVKIREYERTMQQICNERYPETAILQQVPGVGPITALAYVLTLESADRFEKSRDVGPYLGLVPKRDQSGATDKPLSISKAGNANLRRLLVQSANHIMGPFGKDCDLRRSGERIASRGGKIARRKAKVAVARRLAVLLHHLWKTGEEYHPIMKKHKTKKAA